MPVACKHRDPEAYQKAWDNRRFIFAVMKKHFGNKDYDRNVAFDDGLDALCGAFERFDPNYGGNNKTIGSYGSYSVRLAIMRSIARDRLIHIPDWIRKQASKDIAEGRESEREEVRDARKAMRAIQFGDESDEYQDFVQSAEIDEETDNEPTPVSDRIQAAIDSLTPAQYRVVRLIYGFDDGGRNRSLATVGDMLGITEQAVDNAHKRAIAALRRYFEGENHVRN